MTKKKIRGSAGSGFEALMGKKQQQPAEAEKQDHEFSGLDVQEDEDVDLETVPEVGQPEAPEGDEGWDEDHPGVDVVEAPVEAIIEAVKETPEIDVPEVTPPPVEPTKASEAVAQAIETLPVVEASPEKAPKVDLYAKYANVLSKEQLAAWDLGTMRLYDQTGAKPQTTMRGNYAVDRRRSDLPNQWSNDELLDWLDNQIPTPRTLDEEQLWDELYRRNKLPYNWTHDAVRTFIHTRKRPATTASGILIEDRMRDLKTPNQWSYQEIRAALLGDIACDHSNQKLLEVLRTRSGVSEQFSEKRLIDSLKHNTGEISVDDTLLRSQLEEYKTVMTSHPGHLTEATAGSAQLMLAKAIRRVMARDSVAFYEGWNILLDFINVNYPTLFTPERARKGWAFIALKGDALVIFENIMTLLIQTRNPVGRNRAAKMYNLNTILSKVTSETERNNVIGFYTSR